MDPIEIPRLDKFGNISRIAELQGRLQNLVNALERENHPMARHGQKIASQMFLVINDREAREACDNKLAREAQAERMTHGGVPADSIFAWGDA